MADMGAIMALQKAERLVSTAARAFYTDIVVLVVDTLIREKYIKDKDEDLGSRLNLQPKQVRSALTDLKQEGLVMQEDMEDETYSSRLSTYWYIDLRHAVNVIRLRLHEMQVILNERQQAKMAQQKYVCPRCGEKFGVMEIHRLHNGDSSFCCSHCCPNDTHKDCVRSDYTLVDFHDKRALASVTALIELMQEQMSKSTDPLVPRRSIFELANALRDTVVPSNLPSELRKRGMGGQHRGDVSSAHARFQDDFHHRGRAAEKAAAERTSGGRKASAKPVQVLYTKNWRGQEVVVEIEKSEEEDDDDWGDDSDGGSGEGGGAAGILPSRSDLKRKAAVAAAKEQQAAKRAKKVMPTFLKGSRISGADANGDDADEGDDSEADSDTDGVSAGRAHGAKAGGAHVRRLGAAALNSIEERDEFKKKLLPWTERMKQVWRRQQQELRAEAGANGSDDDEWWRAEEEDAEGNQRDRRDQNGVPRLGKSGGGWVNGGAHGGGPSLARFFVRGRSVPIEALTKEEAAEMSPEEYTRFYALATRDR